MVRIVQDILGLGFSWNANTNQATFYDNIGNIVVFTAGSRTALVNGQTTQIRAGTLQADARIITDMGQSRMFVPIAFFRTLPFAGADVRWNAGAVGFRSVTVIVE